MTIKATQQQMEACARWKHQEPMLLSLLADRIAKVQHDVHMQRDVVALRWAQGRLQELEDLQQLIQNAATYLGKA